MTDKPETQTIKSKPLGLGPAAAAMRRAQQQVEESQATADAIASYLVAGGSDLSGLLVRAMNALDHMLHMNPPSRNLP